MIVVDPSNYFNENYLIEYFNNHIRRKKGGGRDNLTPEKFWKRYKDEINGIATKCLQGNYKFSPYNEKLVLKGRRKYPRVLSIPSIRDRIVLGVLNDYLSEVFADCVNHEVPNSLIDKIKYHLEEQGRTSFLRTDFHDFYGTIRIKLLMNMLSSRISNHMILELIHSAIITPTIGKSQNSSTSCSHKIGIPQGLAISNILSAVYMLSFDKEFGGNAATVYIRYVDDILFLSPHRGGLKNAMLKEIRQRNLRLRLSPEKCKEGIVGEDPLDFIGYTIGNKIFIRKKNVTNFINRVAGLAARCKNEYENKFCRPQFISENSQFIDFYIEEFNLLISGFKLGKHLYGWLPYFQSITDVAALYGMDRVIKNRIMRDIPREISDKVNSLVDTYHAIHEKFGGNLVQDYDAIETISEKKYFLARRGRLDKNKTYSDEQITILFDNYMDFIKKKSEQNIGVQS